MTTTKTAAMAVAVLACAQGAWAAEPETPRPGEPKAQSITDELAQPDWARTADLAIPIKFSGYFWDDTGYLVRRNANDKAGQPNQDSAYMTGRFVLGAAYSRQFGGLSAIAKVEYLGLVNELTKSTYEPHTLDAYVKLGTKTWDFQIGRFLAWEVYYRGQGIELYTAEEAGALAAPTLYLLDYTRGLMNEPGQAALHWFPSEMISFELAGVYGQSPPNNYFGGRPAVDVKWKGLEFIAGAEILRQTPQTASDKANVTSKGYAGRLQYSLPMVTFGVDAAQTSIDFTGPDDLIDTSKSYDKTSFGGFVDIDFWKNSIGLGYHHTSQIDRRGEHFTNNQAFVSYLVRLPIEGLSVKAVYGYARAHLEDIDANSQWENYLNSFRLRVLYEFH
jgi:hypothetical protein